MLRIAAYMRVSTDRQAKEGDSIPAQRDAILKYIDGRQDAVLAGEYIDDGISGTKDDRDELRRLLADVREKKIDMIVFTKLDRWFRSIRHYTATQEVLDKYGVSWLAIWEPVYDTTTAAGRLIVNQMMSIAQFEAENTGQRIRQVFAYKASRGEVLSGKVPLGYRIENKRLAIDETTAPGVRSLFGHYARHGCLRETVRLSASMPGFPGASCAIRKLLKNRKYIGEFRGVSGFCPPIVTVETFDQVQAMLARNIRSPRAAGVYLFSGLLRCGCCGAPMAARHKKAKSGKFMVLYRCSRHYGPLKDCQNGKTINEPVLERYLLENLPGLIDAFRVRLDEEREPMRQAEKSAAALNARLDRLKRLYLGGIIDITEYKKDRETITEKLTALRMPEFRTTRPVEAFDAEKGINLYTALEKPEKRLFWRKIIERIDFNADRSINVFFL